MTGGLPWVLAGVIALVGIVLLGGFLSRVVKFVVRGCGAYLLLALIQPIGLGVGANGVTAAVVALLGLPGFGLLVMVEWMFR